MVTVPGDTEANLATLLSTLESKTSTKEDRLEAYSIFSNHLKEDQLSLFNLDVNKNASKILSLLQQDVVGGAADVCQGALQVLGFCLHDSEIVGCLSSSEGAGVISVLCRCVIDTGDKTTCTRALWCLSKQNIALDVMQKQVQAVISAVEHSLSKWKGQSITVEHEAVNVVARLLQQSPKELSAYTTQWAKLFLPMVTHSAIKVREVVLSTIEKGLLGIMDSQKNLVTDLVPEFKSKIGVELKKLFSSGNEEYVLKCWEIFVQIFGDELHHGSFINHLLPIVELGFKSTSVEIRSAAFVAWQQLIDNFATNPNVLADQKRIKLVMQVLKLNNAKVEAVAMVKLKVWWHYVWLLGSKLSANFEQVCVPLLQFCLGGAKLGNLGIATTPRALPKGTSPITPRLNLTNAGSQFCVFPSLQLKGCEVLAHFLGSLPKDLDIPSHTFSLDPLSHDLISGPAFFVKQASLFVTCTADLISSLGQDIPEGLLYHIWYSLVAHMKNAVENGSKSETRDVLTEFLTQFQVIVLSQNLSQDSILKMFQAVCCLPRKALCSTAYNIRSGEMIHGTPSLFLTELLLTPSILQSCVAEERYMTLFSMLISCGVNNLTGSLEYCHSVIQLLDRNTEFVGNVESLWCLWSALVHPLQEHITKTNEVNQGDALEHNFNCMYATLMFPVTHKLASKMPQLTVKLMLKSWSDLYKTFARLSALVTNAEANISCEDLCQKILETIKPADLEDAAFVDFLVQVCQSVLHSVDFSSLAPSSNFNLNALSPAKWSRRRQKPMENLQSFITMTASLLRAADALVSSSDSGIKKNGGSPFPLQGMINNLVDILNMVFTHVSVSNIISNMIGVLAQPIGTLYTSAAKKTGNKIFNNAFMQKLEKLWLDISTCVQSRYTRLYDSELLEQMAPLFEATFLHPRRQIKNQASLLWNATFSRSSSLVYPESLKPVLSKVKEKTSLVLPGFVQETGMVIEETPVSQMSQAESQLPLPHIQGMPSPHKICGSFLNKQVSPGIKKSPARVDKSETRRVGSAKKNLLSLNDLNDKDFVMIKTPPKKKRVLTDHQKDVLKERREFPAMYNSLELSQDVSLMAQFNTDTQTNTPALSSDSVIIIGSSQSQSDGNTTENTSGKGEETKAEKSDETSGKQTRTKRRKSVRFKDPESPEPSKENKIVESAVTMITATKIAENNNNKELDVEAILVGSDESDILSSETKTSQSLIQKQNLPKSSDIAPLESMSVVSNVSQALGEVSAIEKTSPSLAISSKGNDSLEQKLATDIGGDEESQPLFSWASQLKSLSQSPERKSRSPTRKSLSQEIGKVSPSKSPRRQKPHEQSGSLDRWLIRSPGKQNDSQESASVPMETRSESSVVLAVTVVEETQSPGKFSQKHDTDVTPDSAIHSVHETPPSPTSDPTSCSNRKLFVSDNSDVPDGNIEESDIVAASPTSSKSLTLNYKRGTPVVKVKKLTLDDINQYSPSRKHSSQKDVPPTKENSCRDGEQLDTSVEMELNLNVSHEHDDFSEIQPLEGNETAIGSSQGFDAPKTENLDRKGDSEKVNELYSVGMEEAMDVDPSPMPHVEIGRKSVESDSNNTVDSEKSNSGKSDKDLPCSDNLFTEVDYEAYIMASPEYNPNLESTLKDSDLRPTHSSGPSVNSDSESSGFIQSSEEHSSQSQETSTFHPENIATFADEKDGMVLDHKRSRKQKTPKKMSLEELTPRRSRRTPKPKAKGSPDPKAKTLSSKKLKQQSVVTEEAELEKTDSVAAEKNKKNFSKNLAETDSDIDGNNFSKNLAETNSNLGGKSNDMTDAESAKRLQYFEKPETSEIVAASEGNQISVVAEIYIATSSQNNPIVDIDFKQCPAVSGEKTVQTSDSKQTEKTPETKSSQKEPLRRSTTKQKKEFAQKMSLSRKTVNQRLSNLVSSGSSDDDVPLKHAVIRKQEANHASQRNLASFANSDDKSKTVSKSSESSDDNIPLISLGSAKKSVSDVFENSNTNNLNDHNESKKLDTKMECDSGLTSSKKRFPFRKPRKKLGKPSPLSTRLRSAGRVLRAREKGHFTLSPSLRQSVKRTFENVSKTKFETKTKKVENLISECEIVCVRDSGQTNGEVESEGTPAAVDTGKDLCTDVVIEVKSKEISVPDAPLLDEEKETPCSKSVSDTWEETPRKSGEKDKAHVMKSLQNSGGKILAGRRRLIVRRSILKPPGSAHSPEKSLQSSLKDFKFRPIRVARVFSPSASPSAGILKKRKLSGESTVCNSPSPPSKQRRVSFAEPLNLAAEASEMSIQSLETTKMEAQRPPSPLVTSSSATRVVSSFEKFITTSSGGGDTNSPNPGLKFKSFRKDSQPSQLDSSYKSTQESQLNTTDPIYPELRDCPKPVEQVLPQLTSSIWYRGLGQLVRARNIHTIGDLSTLTECQIHNLPIRSPKVATVQRVLDNYAKKQKTAKPMAMGDEAVQISDCADTADKAADNAGASNMEQSQANEEERESLPAVEDAVTGLSPQKGPEAEELENNIDDFLQSSGTLLESVNSLSKSLPGSSGQSEQSGIPCAQKENPVLISATPTKAKSDLLCTLQSLVEENKLEDIEKLKSEEIFEIHQHITALANTVVAALKAKCHSPHSSQE